jgi:hypothetical protein
MMPPALPLSQVSRLKAANEIHGWPDSHGRRREVDELRERIIGYRADAADSMSHGATVNRDIKPFVPLAGGTDRSTIEGNGWRGNHSDRRMKNSPSSSEAATYSPLRIWLTKEQYFSLDPTTRERYSPVGDEYRLQPTASELRQENFALITMAALVIAFSVLGAYAIITDNYDLEILALCGAVPTLLGFLVQLMIRFSA